MYDFVCANCKGIDQSISLASVDKIGNRHETDWNRYVGFCSACLRAPLVVVRRKGKERMESQTVDVSGDIAWLAAWGRSEITGTGKRIVAKKRRKKVA